MSGGFATRAEAEKALRKGLDRFGPGGGRATITLAGFVDEYLEMHQAAPRTIAKLRWLLGKATAVLGEKRLVDLSPRDVYAWRFSVPEGHRFEATQALRQVLRAVCWGLLDYNPSEDRHPQPSTAGEKRSGRSKRGAGRSRRGATRAGVRADGTSGVGHSGFMHVRDSGCRCFRRAPAGRLISTGIHRSTCSPETPISLPISAPVSPAT
jgi:hypothetical protein